MMTKQTQSSAYPRIDAIVDRQRRGLTLDTLFAMLVAMALLFSVIGLRSTTSSQAESGAPAISYPTSVAPGCVANAAPSSDLSC